ncbi:glycosyltransferase family 2 protein, partial [Candidatus Acetothermia bacterium]
REKVHEMDYGIEMALSKLAAKEGWTKEKVKLDGVTHVLKEEKRGFSQGIRERFKMYGDMIKWLIKKL